MNEISPRPPSPPPAMASSMLLISLLLLLLQALLLKPTNAIPVDELSPRIESQFYTRAKVPDFPDSPTRSTNGSPVPATATATLPNLQYPMARNSEVVIFGNATLSSPNRTFELGFFSTNNESPKWYLGIWYALIPVPTYVWVANRGRAVNNLNSSSLEITGSGRLVVKESGNSIVWSSTNAGIGVSVELLENGNLVLLTQGGTVAWQSFDYPTDTWLPGMNLTSERGLTCWRSYIDPSPGLYSLRLRPPEYGEFELVFNGTASYWTTGNWTGNAFANVPQMTVPYIYKFHFIDPFTPTASFGFTESPLDGRLDPPLTRFQMDPSGQLRQFTWATQTWNTFWFQPEKKCRVFGMCGPFGVCNGETPRPCECDSGFQPVDESSWNLGDYSGGCRRVYNEGVACGQRDDRFDKVGVVRYVGSYSKPYRTDFDDCQDICLLLCTCIGVDYDNITGICRVYNGSLSNLQNLSSESGFVNDFYLRVQKSATRLEKKVPIRVVLSASIVGSIVILGFVAAVVVIFIKVREKKKREKEKVQLILFFPPRAAQKIIEGNVREVIDNRLGCTYNIEEAERAAMVAVWCIQDAEAMRPTMGMVVKMLEGLVEVTVPPAPKLLQALVSGESFCGVKADSGIGLSNGSDFSGYNTRLSSGCSESSIGSSPQLPDVNTAHMNSGGWHKQAADTCLSTSTIVFASFFIFPSEKENKHPRLRHRTDKDNIKDGLTALAIVAIIAGYSRPVKVTGFVTGTPEENVPVKAEASAGSSSAVLQSPTLMIDGVDDAVSSLEPAELHHAPPAFIGSSDGDYPVIHTFQDAKSICFVETTKLWSIAGPIAFNILCNYGVNSFTNIFVGHIGNVELSAVAISLSVISNFSFGFLLGMASALETLCGQAFGAGQVDMLGVYMQRSWIILFAACIAILPLYIYSAPVLKLLGQEDDIADLAGKFSIQTIPQMFSLAINFPTQKFLQAQSKVGVLAWIGFISLIAHIGILFLFIKVFGWGTGGAAAAYDISAWGMALAQVVYIVGWCTDGWKGLSWLAFKELWSFAKLSIASAVMLCLEIWYFMTIIVLTGHLDDPVIAVGSLSICMNVNGWEGMLFIGINAAISVRVSNELGSAHPRAAKYSVIITILESLLIGMIFALVILAAKDHFAIIFTESKEMQQAVSRLAFLLSVTMLLNSVQPVISGVAVGGGWQALVAYINLFCYYIVGLPLGFLLGYRTSLRVEGIWIGMIFGTLLQTLILLYIVYNTNWNKEVEQASERMRQWTGEELGDPKKWSGQENGLQTQAI
ncbi:hypothetical protein DVH24_014678 [Malus domestica]|uniref:Protein DETOXIFICATION n=2 Tax=Malus domestica TaxID=3750 RepID=A0A498KQS5_MALDO|nr:hypothetical protein DVH24_009875 [Malus domestica]RXI08112.1 hypothetical protein DVH24_014678 [Malus domestica]